MIIEIIEDVVQNSPEWFALKAGKPSASNFDKIILPSGQPSKQREKYMYQLAGETITGIREEGYQNGAMLRGIEMEQEAADFYELIKDQPLEKVGIWYRDENREYLCSPDRIAGEGLLEIKCPQIQTVVGYLLDSSKLEKEYFQQVQGQLFITGKKWCDLMAYYPGLKPVIIRIKPDKTFHEALKTQLDSFVKELKKIVEKIT